MPHVHGLGAAQVSEARVSLDVCHVHLLMVMATITHRARHLRARIWSIWTDEGEQASRYPSQAELTSPSLVVATI
jgi:hypothetical protein